MSRTSDKELEKRIKDAHKLVEIGARYRHSKTGGEYILHSIGLIEATLTPAIVYKATYNERLYFIRPINDFLGETEIDGKKMPRFKKI